MTNLVTPATLITVPTWTNLTILRNASIVSGVVTPNMQANVTVGNQEYLGDSTGVPTQLISSMPTPGTTSTWSNAVLNLTEVLTRADGSKLTVAAILDELALAAVPPVATV